MKKLKKLLLDKYGLILLFAGVIIFFNPFIVSGKIPIPADTIVGMYHPFRDKIWDVFTGGVPYKNFLITDPVRQQYLWRKLAISQFREGMLPTWNPYAFSGMPLLANFQSAVFYPFNLLFFVMDFNLAWGILVMLQTLLLGLFTYLFINNKLKNKAVSLFGALAFSYCGFTIAWLEWNTIIQTLLYLPLLLLCIDKIFAYKLAEHSRGTIAIWFITYMIALASSFFAGHLQIFSYIFIFSHAYLLFRLAKAKERRLPILLFSSALAVFIGVTSVQWWPTFKLILYSARDVDLNRNLAAGFFLPWQNLVQFIAPDFFGNPASQNYWGIWNYGEFIAYIGIIPLIFALFGIIYSVKKKPFLLMTAACFVFILPNFFSIFIYKIGIPFFSTSQPTRLLSLVDFILVWAAAFGLVSFLGKPKKKLMPIILIIIDILILIIWLTVLLGNYLGLKEFSSLLLISRRNLYLPTLLIGLSNLVIFLFSQKIINKKLFLILILTVTTFDLFRFGWKFTPFSKNEWLFPQTNTIKLLQHDQEFWRSMSTDGRLLPPNFNTAYGISDVSGYDPLYLLDYNLLVSVWGRDNPELLPGAFNRIVIPTNYHNFISDLLGVKYILSMEEISDPKLKLINVEGATYLYENTSVFPRVFLTEKLVKLNNAQEEMEQMFSLGRQLKDIATTTDNIELVSGKKTALDQAAIISYKPGNIKIEVQSTDKRLLVLSDIYYPTWTVKVNGIEQPLFQVDYILRGVVVPNGKSIIEFSDHLL